MPIKKISELNLKSLISSGGFHSSPNAWEDHVFYFLLVDRFSDNNERGYKDNNGNIITSGQTPLFTSADNKNAIQNEADASKWRIAGNKYAGGTLEGIT